MTYMTETESDRFVCPMGIGAEVVHIKGVPVGKACVGRRCAAWRWETIVDDWNEKTETWDIHHSDFFGYCGFIGD